MKRLPILVVGAMTSWSLAIVPNTGKDSRFSWVGQCGGASATAIMSRSVITAKHVGASTFQIPGGEMYTAIERINHPTMDIALLNFDEDLPGWHTLATEALIGAPLSMVGFGRTGVVNDTGTGYDIWWWSGGVRIAGMNTLHERWNIPGIGPSLISWLGVNGDAAGVSGDSGGAFFIDDKLAGVTAFAMNVSGGRLPNYGFAVLNGGVPYHLTGAVDLTDPEVHQWVLENAVPEPATIVMLLLAMAMAARHKRASLA